MSLDWLLNWCALIIASTLSQPTSSWHVHTTLSSSHDSHHTLCSPTDLVAIAAHQLTQASLKGSCSLVWLCTLSILLLRTCSLPHSVHVAINIMGNYNHNTISLCSCNFISEVFSLQRVLGQPHLCDKFQLIPLLTLLFPVQQCSQCTTKLWYF